MVETLIQDSFDNPTVEIAFYVSQQQADAHPVDTGEVAANHMAQVLDLAELNYEIHYRLPVQVVPDFTDECDEPFQTWNTRVREDNIPVRAKDSNALLVPRVGGGCGSIRENPPSACIFGAAGFGDPGEYALFTDGSSDHLDSIHGMLHEVGHNMGFSHEPHGGYGFNDHDDEVWRRTPVVGGNDVENACHEFIEERQYGPAHKYLFYHWCAVSNFNIAGTDETASPPSQYPPTLNGQSPPKAEMLSLPPGSSSIEVAGCGATPGNIGPGDFVRFFADVENVTEVDLIFDLEFYLDGSLVDSIRDIELVSGDSVSARTGEQSYSAIQDGFGDGELDVTTEVVNAEEIPKPL